MDWISLIIGALLGFGASYVMLAMQVKESRIELACLSMHEWIGLVRSVNHINSIDCLEEMRIKLHVLCSKILVSSRGRIDSSEVSSLTNRVVALIDNKIEIHRNQYAESGNITDLGPMIDAIVGAGNAEPNLDECASSMSRLCEEVQSGSIADQFQ